MMFVGDDWAEDHHDVYVMDEAGDRLASRRYQGWPVLGGCTSWSPSMPRTPPGGDGHRNRSGPVGRGAGRGGLSGVCDQSAGRGPLPGPPQVSGAKSDPADAKVLADLVRTDRHNHRPIAGDSPTWRRSRCWPEPIRI